MSLWSSALRPPPLPRYHGSPFQLDGATAIGDGSLATGKVLNCCFMKNLISQARVLRIAGALLSIPIASSFSAEPSSAVPENTPSKAAVAAAQDSAAPSPAIDSAQAKLPDGVADVLKLSRAKVSEEVVLSYVQNSGTAYSLSADDIVRMRNEGVSDRVISAMLDQHKKAMETVQTAAAPVSLSADVSGNSAAAPASEPAPSSVQPPAVEAPLTPPASSVYVIPDSAATAAYYGYYGPYYYGGPVVSFGFGFGGCGYYGHGYYGHGIHGSGHSGHGHSGSHR